MEKTNQGVSCIVRTCNRPGFLDRALKSIVSQSFRNIQAIIVNDGGPSEQVESVISKYLLGNSDIEFKVIHHTNQMGRWVAANAGLACASRELIHIHDDDDTIHPDFYQKLSQHLATLGDTYFGVCSFIECINEAESAGRCRERNRHPWTLNRAGVCIADLAVSNPIVPIGLLYKRNIHDLAGGYREELPVLGDWEFYLRAFCHKSIAILPEELAYYHLRKASTSANSNSIVGDLDKHYQYDAYVRDYYFRNTEEYPKLGALLQQGRMNRSLNRIISVNGSLARRIIRRILGKSNP